jgi:hypothetical protein
MMTQLQVQKNFTRAAPAPWPDRPAGLPGGAAHLDGKDAARIRELHAAAAGVPVAEAALGWAALHDIRYETDKLPRGMRGVYRPRHGIVFFDRRALQGGAVTLDMLVHELRHAWQDYYGLVPSRVTQGTLDENIIQSLMQQAFYEADASAHQCLTVLQSQGAAADPSAVLRHAFFDWFDTRAEAYHLQTVAADLAATAPLARLYNRLTGARAPRGTGGIDPFSQSDLEKLGRAFTGGNYLTGLPVAARDMLHRRLRSGLMTLSAYDADYASGGLVRPERLLRRRQLRHALARPQPRYPLPE